MLIEAIQKIADAIDTILPVKFFAVTKSGRIKWINKRMLAYKNIADFRELNQEDAFIFGEAAWLRNKEVIYSNKESISYESTEDKDFIAIRMPYSEKGFRGLLGFFIDITALKQAEKAKKEFLISMTHDLRTPLSGIYTLAELLSQRVEDKETKQHLDYIVTCSKQWITIVNQIIKLTVDEEIGPIYFHLRELLLEIRELYLASARLKSLEINIKCRNYRVYLDRFSLKKILINLVSNAIIFTEKGTVQINAHIKQEILTLEIEDTGIGISAEQQASIFEQNTTEEIDNQGNNTTKKGWGLFLTKKTVEKLGGTITLTSQIDKGSRFQIAIPLLKKMMVKKSFF